LQDSVPAQGSNAVKIRAKNSEGYKLLLPGRNGRTGHKAYQQGDILFCRYLENSGKKP
jgi:hypothetical protein